MSLIHCFGCPYSGQREILTLNLIKKATKLAMKSGELSSHNVRLMRNLLIPNPFEKSISELRRIRNSAYYARARHGLTGPEQRRLFPNYLETIESKGYVVTREGNACITTVVPYAKSVLKSFYSPVFVDGTHTSDKKLLYMFHALRQLTQ